MYPVAAARGHGLVKPSIVLASLAVVDSKVMTAASTADVSLATMGLSFGAGNALILLVFGRRLGNADCALSAGAATGWTEVDSGAYQAAGTQAGACRMLWIPSAVGTENAVNAFDHVGTGTITDRFIAFGFSLSYVGTPTVGGNPSRTMVNTDPPQQTIDCGGVAGPVFAWSAACMGGLTEPANTFDTETPTHNLTISGSSAGLIARCKTKLWAQGETANNILTDMADLGNQNGLMSGFIRVANP